MKMYRGSKRGEIKEIEAESQTEHFVTIAGSLRREKKTTDYDCIRETRQEVKDWIIEQAVKRVELAERNLRREQENLQSMLDI